MPTTAHIITNARRAGVAVLAFNVPYLPMVAPVIRAVREQDAFALVETARLEWIKFAAHSAAAVQAEFAKWNQPDHVRLHLDHVPVIDEDHLEVDYISVITQALELGYQSVMVDGSRLNLEENIDATRRVVTLAHRAGVPCEAELGMVMGHEAGPTLPYDELFESGRGFTDVQEAQTFVQQTGCDWLSVAVGNIHGAVSGAMKDEKKVEARLDLAHLERLQRAVGIPLVLHGGSGINRECLLASMKHGIGKINVGTEIRQAYERALKASSDVTAAQEAVYEKTCWLIGDHFNLAGTRQLLTS